MLNIRNKISMLRIGQSRKMKEHRLSHRVKVYEADRMDPRSKDFFHWQVCLMDRFRSTRLTLIMDPQKGSTRLERCGLLTLMVM